MAKECGHTKNNGEPCTFPAKYSDGKCGHHTSDQDESKKKENYGVCGAEKSNGERCTCKATYNDGKCGYHTQNTECGRPTKVEALGDEVIKHIENGFSLSEVNEKIGISSATVHRWRSKGQQQNAKQEYKDFVEKLKQTEWWEYKQRFGAGDSRVEVECELCGDTKLTTLSRAEEYDRHICSEHNPAELQSIGGRTRSYMGPNWNTQRQRALERDCYTCQSCGMDEKEHLEKYDQELHVHHIVARRHFDDEDPEQNDLSNLTTLCRDCHEVYEGCSISPVHRVEV